VVSGGAGVGYALLSFLFAGLNDVVFKRYSGSGRSSGLLVFGVGVAWTVLQALLFSVQDGPLQVDVTTLWFGVGTGTLLVVANILLLESLGHVDLSLGSTIYRLNTVVVVALSYLVLRESIGPEKGAGIALGVVAVLLLSRRPSPRSHGRRHAFFVAMVVSAAICRAAYGVMTRRAMLAHASPQALLLLVSSSWIVGGAIYAVVKDRRLRLTRDELGYSACSGAFVFLIVHFLTRAVELGEASVVIPIANMSFVVSLSVSLARGMEKVTVRKVLAAGVAVIAIVLLSRA